MRMRAGKESFWAGCHRPRPRKCGRGEEIPMAIAVGTRDVQDDASSSRAFQLDMLASDVKLSDFLMDD